jgi:hypothetical protein
VNTDPENFRWERDKTFVRAGVPGLYEVTFGFFAKKNPRSGFWWTASPCSRR